jgi:hypothetical protein
MDREISVYQKLFSCADTQNKLILDDDLVDLMVIMVKQKELINQVTLIENEITEEVNELGRTLSDSGSAQTSFAMSDIFGLLQKKHSKLTELLRDKCNILNLLIDRINFINSHNIEYLQQCQNTSHSDSWKGLQFSNGQEFSEELINFDMDFINTNETVLEKLRPQ